MILHEIHDLSNQYAINLLSVNLAQITDPDVIKNYHPDYSDQPGNLFKILKEGRYKKGKGKYWVIENNGEYAGSAGWNEYELMDDVALVLSRIYVPKKYRSQYNIGNYILPHALIETSNYKKVWMTFNKYNKGLYSWFVRNHEKRRTTLYAEWPDIYKKFYPIGKQSIYYTDQYVVELDKKIL